MPSTVLSLTRINSFNPHNSITWSRFLLFTFYQWEIWGTLSSLAITASKWPSWDLNSVRLQNRRRRWHPTPVLLPGKSHGWRSPVGCSPWDCSESDRTEQLHFHFSPSCIGEGNGNPLQCSCLENPRDRGAWWAVVYGVIQSRTQLKWLSSSSSSSRLQNPVGNTLGKWMIPSCEIAMSFIFLLWALNDSVY